MAREDDDDNADNNSNNNNSLENKNFYLFLASFNVTVSETFVIQV